MSTTRKILRDDQWMKLAALLPGKEGDRRRTGQDNRLFLEAVLWIVQTGSPWRDLPVEQGNWHTTYTRFKRWGKAGVWGKLVNALSGDLDMEALMIDSTELKQFKRVATRYDKLASRSSSFIAIVASLLWLK